MSDLLSYILADEPQFKKSRLPSLYSDFRHLKTVNPDGYDANLSAWRAALAHAVRQGLISGPTGRHDLLNLYSGPELLRALETKEYGQPVALGTVINVGIARKDFIPLERFVTSSQERDSPIWRLLRWTFSQLPSLWEGTIDDKLPIGRLVVMSLVKECAKRMLSLTAGRDHIDRIFPITLFKLEFARIQHQQHNLTDPDFEVVLYHLSHDLHECAYDGEVVKFRGPSDSSHIPLVITHEDSTIASLKQLIASHETQITLLTARIDDLSNNAKSSIARKNRIAALSALRLRKLAETALTGRTATLAQLEEVLVRIRQAADQIQLVRVMEGSTGVLKALHREMGGVERVEDVVEKLREEMARVDELGGMVVEMGTTGTTAMEEGEVEDELDALETEERERQEMNRKAETARKLAELNKVTSLASSGEQKQTEVTREHGQTNTMGRLSIEENTSTEPRSTQITTPEHLETLSAA